eukprot:494700-Prymnesium_polylepis.1
MLANTPAEPWLSRLKDWQQGPYFYSHVTDVLRFALLFHIGGVYLDFDVIVTRPFDLATTATPMSSATRLHNAIGIESLEGLGGLAGPTLNGAVMVFDRGSRFLWNCLDDFAMQYIADRWSWNGPELLTRVQLKCRGADGAAVQVEPRESFYPIHWNGLADFADGEHQSLERSMWSTIHQSSYVVHVWNRKAAACSIACITHGQYCRRRSSAHRGLRAIGILAAREGGQCPTYVLNPRNRSAAAPAGRDPEGKRNVPAPRSMTVWGVKSVFTSVGFETGPA